MCVLVCQHRGALACVHVHMRYSNTLNAYTVTGMLSHFDGATSGLRPFKNLLYNIKLILAGSWSAAFSIKNMISRVSTELIYSHLYFILLYHVWHTHTVNSFPGFAP